ncbi:peptidyl-tRNA hydrolase [Planctomycetales bacterium]|nr:peptidyl-tRNA hydrolase [Planctomycetales bacterium]
MKLIVGLGNPGRVYKDTRHNVGFMTLQELAQRFSSPKPKTKFRGELVDVRTENGETVLFLAPATFMNNSGLSVAEAVKFYKIEYSDVLVVCDDMNLPFCKLRLRDKGSSGGQKGLDSIINMLHSEEIPRLRFGIGRPPEMMDAADYVLSPFTAADQKQLKTGIQNCADAVLYWINKGIAEAMNKYN